VTGLPSDTAVVRSEVAGDGGDPDGVDEITIGFNAVSALAAGKVDAATGFWNAEAIEAGRQGIPLRVFKVDQYGAPRYPELILTTTRKELQAEPDLVERMVAATRRGYNFAVSEPQEALGDLVAANPSLERADQAAQLKALLPDLDPLPFDRAVLQEWSAWASEHELLPKPANVAKTFDLGS
jgi:NitT/TauT family transport system substrate-binding protein/putative hydroxymethylpyrimidine transport system substrate-binding protein